MKREGVKRMVSGGVLFFLVAPGIFVLAIILGLNSVMNAVENGTQLNAGETTRLEAGESVSIFVSSDRAFETGDTGIPEPTTSVSCTATDPAGSPANLRQDGGASVSDGGIDWQQQYTLTATDAGDYAIDCGSASALILDEDIAAKIGSGAAMFVFLGFILPFIVGVIAIALFVWGLVRFNKTKPQPGFGYPGAGGYGGPAPYQQGGTYPQGYPGQNPGQGGSQPYPPYNHDS